MTAFLKEFGVYVGSHFDTIVAIGAMQLLGVFWFCYFLCKWSLTENASVGKTLWYWCGIVAFGIVAFPTIAVVVAVTAVCEFIGIGREG